MKGKYSVEVVGHDKKKVLVEEAPLVSTIPEIPEDIVESHKGY